MKVLAIDPGYERVGVAIVSREKHGRDELIFSTCIETSRTEPFEKRLRSIGDELERIIKEYSPDSCALERLYFHSNQKTALLVAEACGVARYTAARHELPVYEYTPLQIKNAVSGDGRGDKKQIMYMVRQLISIKKPIKRDDEFDAIAIGLTCLASERF